MLVKLIIETLPTYTMQVVATPSITLEEIEKYQRAFILGHEVSNQKIRTILWDKICNSKAIGGLGFCNMRRMNNSYLMKRLV